MRLNWWLAGLFFLGLYSCTTHHPQPKRFELLSPDHTHVTFSNTIEESDSVNILNYEYLYNGGGVGILDVNQDGLPDLFFTGNRVANALYLNKGNFQFEDISATAGIALKNEWYT